MIVVGQDQLAAQSAYTMFILSWAECNYRHSRHSTTGQTEMLHMGSFARRLRTSRKQEDSEGRSI